MRLATLDREIEEYASHEPRPRPPPLTPGPVKSFGFVSPVNHAAGARRNPRSARFDDLFAHAPARYVNRFQSLTDFAPAVQGGTDSRLIVNAAMGEGSGTSGGFPVPTTWAGQLFDDALQLEAIRPRRRVLPMDAPNVNIAVVDNESNLPMLANSALSIA